MWGMVMSNTQVLAPVQTANRFYDTGTYGGRMSTQQTLLCKLHTYNTYNTHPRDKGARNQRGIARATRAVHTKCMPVLSQPLPQPFKF